jgi:cation diffusion facilitator CzcD-associated flavoprotein CzcO
MISAPRDPADVMSTVDAPNPKTTDAVVVGAGPYGLSIGAHLLHRGLSTRVFGEPMSSWQSHMPVGMYLKSEPSASSLHAPVPGYTLRDYQLAIGERPLVDPDPVPISTFVSYGLWFHEQLVPVERERVTHVARKGGEFEVTLGSGEVFRTRNVVMASGHVQFANLPPAVAALAQGQPLPTSLVSHTCNHPDLGVFADRDVAVIGGGQSALESAALLHEAGAAVHLLVRDRKVVWGGNTRPEHATWYQKIAKPPSPLGPGWSLVAMTHGAGVFRHLPERTRMALVKSILGPFGSWWLHDRVMGAVDVRTGQHVAAATIHGDKVELELSDDKGQHEQLIVDHVLAGTGYRVDIDAIELLDAEVRGAIERTRNYPSLNANYESSVPGLFFAGLSSAGSFGPLMRFVCGTDFCSPRLARGVAAR